MAKKFLEERQPHYENCTFIISRMKPGPFFYNDKTRASVSGHFRKEADI